MVRVWFNHWFSTSYRLIELMKQDREEQVYIIGTNKQVNSIIQEVCDEWYQDPDIGGEEYIEYCLKFCKEHQVDVFVPRRLMVLVSENRERFEALGVKLMVDDFQVISFLNDKAATYDFFRKCEGLHIPDYYIVNTAEQFKEAYAALKEKFGRICIKFVKDEGGMSFRKIVDRVDSFTSLRMYPGNDIAYDTLMDTLGSVEQFDDLMVMPYLPGEEISVDCLSTEDGLIAVPRIKGSARHEKVEYPVEILDMVHIIMEKVKLECPCNIQFKIKDGVPYLLEINTRMSGGLQMSCLAAGVNIPNIALNKLLGKRVEWSLDKTERIVSYIEIPKVVR
ncbi:MAG: ATP-grasp domain-containing protein [Lachnospiraceae bacterium]|nr:ATP-grasp domain-containing protein [Lachnospiraceae bacterium]